MLSNLLERLKTAPPRGYRPGETLRRALSDLRGVLQEAETEGTGAAIRIGGIACTVRERVEEQFLMHVVSLDFLMHVAIPAVPALIRIHNTGIVTRTGIACSVAAAQRQEVAAVTRQMEQDRTLEAALTRLAFRRCEITGSPGGWSVRIEPYGLSEVVNRMPPLRRYIGLGDGEAQALAAALVALHGILSPAAAAA